VVLRGFVKALEITEDAWELHARNIEFLKKFDGLWVSEDTDTYLGL